VPALASGKPNYFHSDTARSRTGQHRKWERIAALALHPRAVVVARPSSRVEHCNVVALDVDEAPGSRRGRPANKRESHDENENGKPQIR
jgi:hypothetical protein